MKKYKCIKPLILDKYDDDGFLIENEQAIVDIDEIYETCQDYDEHLLVACKPAIHLERVHENIDSWIEIYPETLKEYFEEVEDNSNEKNN